MIYEAELDRCAGYIAQALPYCFGNYEWADIRQACLEGKMQLWPGANCALVTEICYWPRRTGCNVFLGGGDLEELKALAPQVLAWAKSIGCDHVTVFGRKGWARALGMGEQFTVGFRKDL